MPRRNDETEGEWRRMGWGRPPSHVLDNFFLIFQAIRAHQWV